MIQHFEGYRPFIYSDIVGVQTVGFGHALQHGEAIKQPLLPKDAQTLLESDLKPKERAINQMVNVRLRHNQFDALADFTYNLGEGTLKRSTLLKEVNAKGEPGFLRYDKAGGVPVRGLTYRREAEVELYAR